MMNNVRTCEQDGCKGHLSKFDSCRDQALWEISLDDSSAGCGDGDWEGYACPVVVESPEDVELDGTGPTVTVPVGFYLVYVASTGGVTVHVYETREGLESTYAGWEAAYLKWETEDID